MNKRYKLLPCSIWNIGLIETWLSKMAAKGLFIENFGRYFTKFIKGEPSTTHYRIDVIPAENDDELKDIINKYEVCGWKYVNTYMNFHIFSSPHEFNTSEVYNITEEQADLLKPQYKKKIKDIILGLIILVIFLMLPSFFKKFDLYTFLLELNLLDIFAFITLTIGFFYQIYEAFILKRLIKHLEQGIPINHNCNWKLRSCFSIFYKTAFVIIVVIFFFLPYKQFFTEDFTFIENNIEELPVVTLKDISNIKLKYTGNELKVPDPKWANSQSFLLMPVNYEVNQFHRKFIKPNNYETLDLKSNTYQLRFEALVNGYILELIKQQNEITTLIPVSIDTEQYKDFDILKVYKYLDTYYIYVARDNGILTVSYLYDDDIDSVIKAMDEKMELLLNHISKS